MRKRLIIINFVVIFLSLLLMVVVSTSFIISNNNERVKSNLNDALTMATRIYDGSNASEVCNIMYSSDSNIRITIISSDGEVLSDTMTGEIIENHLDRPEIKNLGEIYKRYSKSLDMNMLYIAALDDGSYIRVAIPEYKINNVIEGMAIISICVSPFFNSNNFQAKMLHFQMG